MKKAIVTGATGFIGTILVENLCRKGIEVIAVIRKSSVNKNKLIPRNNLNIIECDMSDIFNLSKYTQTKDVDVFFHLAWEGSAGEGRADYNVQLLNIEYTINALKVANSICCKKFVGVGSLMEFEINYLMEKDKQIFPNNIYNISKYTAHVMSKALSSKLEIDYIWTYITNAYGEYETSPRFFNTTVKKMINKEVMDFTLADNLYDFVHVEDVVNAMYLIGKHGKNDSNYCIGSGKPEELKKYITKMRDFIDRNLDLNFGKVKSSMIYLNKDVYSIEKTTNDTGYVPKIDFEEGLERVLNITKYKEKESEKF